MNFNKFLSGVAVVALVAVMMPVKAVNANPTVVYTDVGADLVTTNDTLAVTIPATVVDQNGDIIRVVVTDNTGSAVNLYDATTPVTVVDGANATSTAITADFVDVTVANAAVPATITLTFSTTNSLSQASYAVTVTGTAGVGASMFAVLSANVVQVSATVVPLLTFNLDSNSIDLGTLATDYTASDSLTFDVSTNAQGGVDVDMVASGLTDGSNGIGQTNLAGVEVTSTYYKVTTHGTPAFTDGGAVIANDTGADIAASNIVYSGSAPVSVNNQLVTIAAKITAVTPAGSYADTLTFTATATF